MSDVVIHRRLDRLEYRVDGHDSKLSQIEDLLKETIYLHRENEKNIAKLHMEIQEFKEELRSDTETFKKELRADTEAFKKELQADTKAFKDESRAEIETLTKKIQDVTAKIDAWCEEMRQDRKEMNRKWGELARKMGTIVEDIVAPGLPYAIEKAFGMDVEDLMVRRRKKLKDGRVREYDVIAICGDFAFVVDVKATYKTQYFQDCHKLLAEFKDFFPEFKELKLVGVIASLYLREEMINTATHQGLLALNLSGEYLEFMNADKVQLGLDFSKSV